MPTYYEDPTGITKNVLVPVDAVTERQMADAEDREITAILLPHRARGAITLDECPAWAGRLRTNHDLTVEILDALPGNDALADRMFAEDAEIRSLKDQLDRAMGVSEEVRAYDESAGLPEAERQYREFARMTNDFLAR